MIDRAVTITAPSRLHFGLLSFGNPKVRQFGGVGLMLERPNIELRAGPSSAFSAHGPLSDRVTQFAQRWHRYYEQPELCRCRIEVLRAPHQHIGLGVGTQLGLSVATALHRITGRAEPTLDELARSVGRGSRSSIGTYGFARGGLLFESGKLPSESISRLEDRVELPSQWRILLICPNLRAGLSGHDENQAFERLPPVSESVTAELANEVQSSMLPAAKAGRLGDFAESVYRYGVRAGECFARQQGGPFANKLLESWVRAIRRRGFPGVGQSSWGPSLFVLQADEAAALECMQWFRRDVPSTETDANLVVATISNHGARLA